MRAGMGSDASAMRRGNGYTMTRRTRPTRGGNGRVATGELERKIDEIAREVGEVKVLVAGMMPRAEVDGELARRVSLEVYTADQRATNERLLHLEGSPMRLIAYLGAASGCLGVLVSAFMVMLYIAGIVIMHYKP